MIDWLTVIVPCFHPVSVDGGEVLSVDFEGNLEWKTKKSRAVRGSYESNLIVKSVEKTRRPDGLYTELYIDGNLAKWNQGHNLWGSDDLTGLVSETYLKLIDILNIMPADTDVQRVLNGFYQVARVDCTQMIDLQSLDNVRAFLYAAERMAYLRHRGRGVFSKETLYFGKKSRRWSVKMYAKGDEINAKNHTLPINIDTPSIQKWASSKLRVELVLRSLELKNSGLHIAANWGDNTPYEVWQQYVGKIEMTDNIQLTDEAVMALKPSIRAAYQLWLDGHNVKEMYPRMTFYRYRKELQTVGIDIAVTRGNRTEPSNKNVVQFRRVIEAKPCEQVPEWAIGTPLYFEPRKNIRYK